ncbi:LEAF RUST 10 DISEASE-RESISTANCE LOCUS RECEPTOR-LIKE PROTEIN KINASE-like 1.2 isoform X1 [Rosa rugosa]|uniref:LEAF RUST 10 DISEASE-RESISTANCE LOCUS RECEPTOR-LIKE PROTEIN KINASE-like 1.2 isoform X1 n=1 Tax=Rosa rugosa TaxID=74645 RepID=UPI002B4028C0|nr:LEAF RUST 10 DISEASE-RESISTANCE LOCUS RECEPTOR-LIKE PROTEIN KINASE-like 1.2 isoform X1 [Rosa rugosa]
MVSPFSFLHDLLRMTMPNNHHLFLRSPPIIIIIIFFFFWARCEDDPQYYTRCKPPFNCGNLTNISYPFWGGPNRPKECGRLGFELTNCEDETQFPHIVIEKLEFHVSNINSQELFHTMTIARSDLLDSPCTDHLVNTTLDYNRFSYVQTVRNLTLYYGCLPQNETVLNNFTCKIDGTAKDRNISYYVDDSLSRVDVPGRPTCSIKILVPIFWEGFDVMPDNATEEVEKVLKRGFQVEYSADWDLCRLCMNSNGTCGSNATTDSFLCLCGDRPSNSSTCPIAHDSRFNWKLKVVVGLCSVIGTVAVMCFIFFIWRRRNRNRYGPSSYASRSIYSKSYSRSDTEKGSAYLGVHVFTYKELEQATNYFDSSREIGDGGFGTVYYGKVRDGRSVAVKRLYETNCKRVEQFMNEIEILARLRHQNLVLLYGCTSRHSRELLLVYEYVPNGTLADHLHGGKAKPSALPWHTRINIAVETASALSYLHASEIIHRDVKTTNILLDNNFCVKVADFGLSRLFPTDVTHISTAPQGTPGYVDPDYNQCYQLTAKSDVYSFGVVLVELISSLPAVDITRHRQEINLSNMAINKIQKHALHELVDPSLGYESDFKVRKMINAVAELAFRCLQNETDMRPSMVDVENELKRIQSDDFSKEKAEEIDISADDVVLLKSGPLPPSPDSVTINWVSKSSTPNDSTG